MSRMGGVAIVVFSDLVDSTALLATLGDDRMEGLRRTHMADVAGAVESAGGRVVKTLGDGAMASFESALGALRAAAAIQASVERLDTAHDGIGVAARVGVAAGEPIPDGDDLHGMTVVIASRLSAAAGTGEVLVQDLVQALVASRDGVPLADPRDYELKGVPVAVRASALMWRELAATVEEPVGVMATASASGASPVEQIEALAPPDARLPAVLAAYVEEPLIGRDREIAALREATRSRPGRRAIVILGEPGIGKTRHAAAAAAEAHEQGARVVLARCPPETVVPFEPWVRAIGELARAGGEEWRESLSKQAGLELASLVPELGEYSGWTEQAGANRVVAAEGARYRLLRGIGAVLECAADGAPLHIVLDDAHWCDPASAQALAHLLESTSVPLVLVVTARDREMGRRHPVSRVLSDLRRTDDLEEMRLAGLDASGVAALIDAKVGRAITPGLAARLLNRTAGNPFFAAELARDLDGRGALAESAELDSAPVPDAVADLVEERLARLEPDTERFLAAVAAIGPSAPVALAAEAAGLSPEQASRAVQEALSERLVDDVAAARLEIAFPHALVREALIAGTGEADRARLHLAIARALEGDPDAEPAELARHFGLAVEIAGSEPAIFAYRAAAEAAAEGHDHEQAAAHLRSVLSLLPESDLAARATTLLELGEQELLSADLVRARSSFLAAIETARAIGDTGTHARAALGFAGGDVGFGWEVGTDDAAMKVLREGLEALGDSEPRLALRMTFRLAYLLVFTEEPQVVVDLGRRASALAERLGDVEARLLDEFTSLVVRFVRGDDGPSSVPIPRYFEEVEFLRELAEECDREDLQFRVAQWSVATHFLMARIPECEEAVERAAAIAERLGTPRFTWEVDMNRCMRAGDRGDREASEMLMRRAGSVVRRLRPDLHMTVELVGTTLMDFYYDGNTELSRAIYEAADRVTPRGFTTAVAAFSIAFDGDLEAARRRIWAVLGEGDDVEGLRRPDGHMPATICVLAIAASAAGDREAGERLRPLLEPLRSYLIHASPSLGFGFLPEWCIGRLELLAGRHDAAVAELRLAVARADELGMAWAAAWVRVDLARALYRRGASGDLAEAESSLAEATVIAERYGLGWASRCAAEAWAEMEGRTLPAASRDGARTRPIRALATRGGQRALGALVGSLDDAELERRYAEPRRQRTLLKGTVRAFQPAQAGGFAGVVAYEIEPFAIEPPADAPWRWAIEVDSPAGKARLIEPAPLDAAVTVHIGLADWVRVLAGLEDPLEAMIAGRCSVEGDVAVGARLQAMFGG
jgi:class 3 adenylate cyclase/tetratricopeptide (TPR) repeat protein